MKSYYSILKFANNSLSGENIALGLIVVSNNQVYFKLSPNKIGFAHKLNPQSKRILDFGLDKIKSFLTNDIQDSSDKLIKFEKSVDVLYLNRLSIYNNGVLQFSKPTALGMEIKSEDFNKFFKKFIDDKEERVHKASFQSVLKHNIETKLYKPLQDKIDVDFKLKKKDLPSLYFDFHFDSIGVNGAICASKAIDFNNQSIGNIQKEIAEYESLITRLSDFGASKGINGEHKYYIISDAVVDKGPSYLDVYGMLKDKDVMPYFELVNSENINNIVDVVNKSKATKFSELLEA
jgi:hypothetical protein